MISLLLRPSPRGLGAHLIHDREGGCVHKDWGHYDGREGPGCQGNDRGDQRSSVLGCTDRVTDGQEPGTYENEILGKQSRTFMEALKYFQTDRYFI